MKIITSGRKNIDIDAYAGAIAYAYLLNLKGEKAKAVSTGNLNESITPSLLSLQYKLDEYSKADDDKFIVVDISYKEFFDKIVDDNKIIEIIDHHYGYEEYWKERLGNRAIIEPLGAMATIIVEMYEKEKYLNKMPKEIAKLLMAAILDNTLNLKADVTTNRDIESYKKLYEIVDEEKFAQEYFMECQKSIENNLSEAINNDIKIEDIDYSLPRVIGQLVLWDKTPLFNNIELIKKNLDAKGNKWIMNVICLKEGKNYILASDKNVEINLEELLEGKFNNSIMETNKLMLRKEIMKKAMKQAKKKSKSVKIIYFVHGTTLDNEKHISTGQNPGELSELGIKQSKELRNKINLNEIDFVICSDLKRAVDSANLIFENDKKIIQDSRIRECDYGSLNGSSSDIVLDEEHIDIPFPNGESMKDVEKRLRNFCKFLLDNYDGKTIALVAHKAPQLALEVITKNISWDEAIEQDWRKTKSWKPGWIYEITGDLL